MMEAMSRRHAQPVEAVAVGAGVGDDVVVGERHGGRDEEVAPRGIGRGRNDGVRAVRRSVDELQFVAAVGLGVEVDGDQVGEEEFNAIDARRGALGGGGVGRNEDRGGENQGASEGLLRWYREQHELQSTQ